MNYTGLSCEDIYNNNCETGNRMDIIPLTITSGFFVTCLLLQLVTLLALVWEEHEEELPVLILVLEMSAPLDGARVLTMV